jgi:hypothetical protein
VNQATFKATSQSTEPSVSSSDIQSAVTQTAEHILKLNVSFLNNFADVLMKIKEAQMCVVSEVTQTMSKQSVVNQHKHIHNGCLFTRAHITRWQRTLYKNNKETKCAPIPSITSIGLQATT